MEKFNNIFLIVVLSFIPGCFFYKKNVTPAVGKTDKVTVSVHGTLPPVARNFVNALESPKGLCPLMERPNALVLSRMGYVLHETDPKMFPAETFYLYGWSGKLCFEEREITAEDLYKALKKLSGKITLIGHSHGGNVILNLARVAEKYNDKNFRIHRIILLATPIQEVYENLEKSPVFENIISIYSNTDVIQVLDPQGLYQKTKEHKKINGTDNSKSPMFSTRLLPDNPKIKQVRVLLNKTNPGHMDFVRAKFLRALPKILKLIDNAPEGQRRFIVNIDRRGEPYFVKAVQRGDGRRVYVPIDSKTA